MKTILINEKGLTLIELLVAMAIFSMVVAGIMSAKFSQEDQHATQIQAAEMQQNARAVMMLMKQELRMAGYNPLTGDYGEGISAATASSITFSYVTDEDGTIESIAYVFEDDNADGDNDITKNVNGGGARLLAENISNLTFTYYDDDGNAILAPVASPDDIRSMDISITAATDIGHLARADAGNDTRTLTARVYLRNMGL